MIPFIGPLIGKVIDSVTGYQNKKKDKEIVKIKAQSKLAIAKQAGDKEIALTDAEWEAIAVSQNKETWKDEYITLVITWPILGLLLGSISMVFRDDPRLVDATILGITKLQEVGVDMGMLMMPVVLAAVGLKAWRGLGR